jgi:hypothetical protein
MKQVIDCTNLLLYPEQNGVVVTEASLSVDKNAPIRAPTVP